MAVTSMEEILRASAPDEVVISGFAPGTDITVRLKRPGFYSLLAHGRIPNPLISEMEKLFIRRDLSSSANASTEYAEMLAFIARESLVEPTYAELEDSGVSLTDDQLVEICLYAAAGAERLRTFRAAVRNAACKHGSAVSDAAEPSAEHRGSICGLVPGRGGRLPADADAERRQTPAEED